MVKVIVFRIDRGCPCVLSIKSAEGYALPTQYQFEGICDQSQELGLQELVFSASQIGSDVTYFVTVLSPCTCSGKDLYWVGIRDLEPHFSLGERLSIQSASFQVLLGIEKIADSMDTCKWCGGYGSVFNRRFMDFGNDFSGWSLPCPVCAGSGTIPPPEGWMPIEVLKSDPNSSDRRLR